MTVKKWQGFFFATWFLMLGALIGFLLAPVKKGVVIGSYNDCQKLPADDGAAEELC